MTIKPDNAKNLRRLLEVADSLGVDRIDSVVVASYASPEGVYEHNIWLSHKRAAVMRKYLSDRLPMLNDKLRVDARGESWHLLREKAENDTSLSYDNRQRVLRIIDADVNAGTKKWRMEQLPFYGYLKSQHYRAVRSSEIALHFYYTTEEVAPIAEPVVEPVATPAAEPIVEPTAAQPVTEPVTEPVAEPIAAEQATAPQTERVKRTIFALKTNLLYDAATALNVELEVPIGKRFSVAVEDVFPWWESRNKYCFQVWTMGIEGRYWFARTDQRPVLSGQFGGVYAMGGKYDLQWKRKWCYQGELWSVGVTYGYAMKISRHLNMEFSLSVGYMRSAYRHYNPAEDWGILIRDTERKGNINYFGPTKAKISLVFPINITVNKKSAHND